MKITVIGKFDYASMFLESKLNNKKIYIFINYSACAKWSFNSEIYNKLNNLLTVFLGSNIFQSILYSQWTYHYRTQVYHTYIITGKSTPLKRSP